MARFLVLCFFISTLASAISICPVTKLLKVPKVLDPALPVQEQLIPWTNVTPDEMKYIIKETPKGCFTRFGDRFPCVHRVVKTPHRMFIDCGPKH